MIFLGKLFQFIKKILLKKLRRRLKVIRKRKIFNLLFSFILRKILQFKFFLKLYFEIFFGFDLFKVDEFWILRIGYSVRRFYLPHLNIDPYLSNKPHFCLDLYNIPLGKESCKEIKVKYLFQYSNSKHLNKTLKCWYSILIPGGILKIDVKYKNNSVKIENLKKSLRNANFLIQETNSFNIQIENTISIKAVKYKPIDNSFPKNSKLKYKDISEIIRNYKEFIMQNKTICLLGYNLEFLVDYLKKLKLNDIKINYLESFESLSKFEANSIDFCIIANYFEFIHNQFYQNIFNELKRVMKFQSSILLIVPEKKNYYNYNSVQYFDKGILVELIDNFNFKFKWISLSSSLKNIEILLINENERPEAIQNLKILLLGNYGLRYSNFNMVIWDAQVRGFESLGYQPFILDIKDYSYSYIIRYIKLIKPDILWVGDKIVINFLKQFGGYFKHSKIKVVYWMWDVRDPIKYDFNGIIDYMFISSKGEIPLYKKYYNIDKIYYMLTPVTPQLLKINKNIKKEYDIGFSGRLDSSTAHKERTRHLKILAKHFNVKSVSNVFNNISEFYSKCKLIFGGAPDYKNLELYTSFRMLYVLCSGCCYLTNYFKGIKKLTENEKHLLWYKNTDEMLEIVKKYINNDMLRHNIEKNSRKLAIEKYHYSIRIKNMIDIIEGKSNEFDGFIN